MSVRLIAAIAALATVLAVAGVAVWVLVAGGDGGDETAGAVTLTRHVTTSMTEGEVAAAYAAAMAFKDDDAFRCTPISAMVQRCE